MQYDFHSMPTENKLPLKIYKLKISSCTENLSIMQKKVLTEVEFFLKIDRTSLTIYKRRSFRELFTKGAYAPGFNQRLLNFGNAAMLEMVFWRTANPSSCSHLSIREIRETPQRAPFN